MLLQHSSRYIHKRYTMELCGAILFREYSPVSEALLANLLHAHILTPVPLISEELNGVKACGSRKPRVGSQEVL